MRKRMHAASTAKLTTVIILKEDLLREYQEIRQEMIANDPMFRRYRRSEGNTVAQPISLYLSLVDAVCQLTVSDDMI